jgi:nitric oxide reductase large subunit
MAIRRVTEMNCDRDEYWFPAEKLECNKKECVLSALMWWLIPVVVLLVAGGVVALITYFRRPTEDHDLGQFASLQEAMSRTQSGVRTTKKVRVSGRPSSKRINS